MTKVKNAMLRPTDRQHVAECLRTLGNPSRIHILELLMSGHYTVGQIAEQCDLVQNVVSQHLRLMERCGFLEKERDGRCVYYRIKDSYLINLLNNIHHRFGTSP